MSRLSAEDFEILLQIAKVVLKTDYDSFVKFLHGFSRLEIKDFILKYRGIMAKSIDVDDTIKHSFLDVNESIIFEAYARNKGRMKWVNWQGEDNKGQVKVGIKALLKKYDLTNFNWNYHQFEKKMNWDLLRSGEYIQLLFSSIDQQLTKISFRIAFFNMGGDYYNYIVLPVEDFTKIHGLSSQNQNGFSVDDARMYSLYLTDKGLQGAKVMLYIKNRLSIPLTQIKIYFLQENILVSVGTLHQLLQIQNYLKTLGAKSKIIEETTSE